MTTEKELDTVEVLKAIQKARDVKEKKTSSITKVHFVKLRCVSALSESTPSYVCPVSPDCCAAGKAPSGRLKYVILLMP